MTIAACSSSVTASVDELAHNWHDASNCTRSLVCVLGQANVNLIRAILIVALEKYRFLLQAFLRGNTRILSTHRRYLSSCYLSIFA